MAKSVLLRILKKSSAVGHSVKKKLPDSSRRDFLRGSALAATSLCFASPLARAAKILRADSTSNSAITVLGKAYADLAANYRQHRSNLSYTAKETRFSFDHRVFTQFKFTHNEGFGESGMESGDAVQKEIQSLARDTDLIAEDFANNNQGFEPTVLLYQGRVHTDERLIKAVRPLCAAAVRVHQKSSGDTPVRGITLSSKCSRSFHPQVVIS